MKRSRRLEDILPVYKIENDCLLSKKGDITLSFQITLPEIFTLSDADYETLHQTWLKAIRLLPVNSILHKQDWYIQASYSSNFSEQEKSFLSLSSDKFFNERPYLDHCCYIFLTQRPVTSKPANALTSSLIKNTIVPQQTIDAREFNTFLDKAGQFVKILEDSGYFKISRLHADDLVGTEKQPGLLERYLFLLQKDEPPVIRDIELASELRIGDYHTQLFTLADVEDLPSRCDCKISYDKYSTDRTNFYISFAAPLGQLLPCNHIYNQYVVIEDPQSILKKLESKRIRLQSLSAYSRENALSRDATNQYLNEAISQQRLPVKAHFNVFAWTDNKNQSKEIRNNISAALAKMDARAKQETVIAPQLFLAGLPGGASELPIHDAFDTFAEQASCFFIQETNYETSISPVGIRLGDRISGKPLHVDISDLPMRNSVISNRNKFVLSSSGAGKSFFCGHLTRSYYETGAHIVLIDVGHSYRTLCDMVGGYYFTYEENNPIQFNPFYLGEGGMDTEKRESLKTLLLSLWKKEDESFSRAEYVSLSNAIQAYYTMLETHPDIFPCFDSFYEFLNDTFYPALSSQGIKDKNFDIVNMLYVLKPFYKGGEFDYLLNAQKNLEMLEQRFIVFELDNIKDHPILFPTVTLVIMEVFISKMRKLKGIRKVILIEEAWKAIARQGMAEYIKYLFKTVRKFFGEAIVVTQDVDDIISSPVIKDAIINNSDCKILLDQSKYINKFDRIQEVLGLSDKEKTLVLSLNKANDPTKKYKEVFISLGGSLSKVYRTEVSLEEYLCYTTEEREKVKVQEYARKYGNIKAGIARLAAEMRETALAA